MNCITRDFGEISMEEKDMIHFVQPPFGFEEYTDYTFIYDQEIGPDIVWLQSVEDAKVCFILFDPSCLSSFYQPNPTGPVVEKLGEGDLVCWVIAVVSADAEKTTVNLKSPIVVNLQTGLGAQIILDQDYPVKYPFMKEAE